MAKPWGSNSLTRAPNSPSNSCARSSGRNTENNLPSPPRRNRSAPPSGRGQTEEHWTVETSNVTSKTSFVKNWLCLLLVGALNLAAAEQPADRTLPVRGFCIASPSGNRVDEFIKFIEEELASRSVNVLILRVDYSFQFLSLPEMADKGGLSKEQAQKIAAVCRQRQIRIIPLVNLLGH